MKQLKYNRELYSKIALIKAAYNFTDRAYVHLDADEKYYYVSLNAKNEKEEISDDEFENEILAQSARHEIYLQTKNIVAPKNEDESSNSESDQEFSEDEILKDWFDTNG